MAAVPIFAAEGDAVSAAGRGDPDAFRLAVEPHWSALHAHCYRLLGSKHDADDALQEALLRAWRGLSSFDRGRPLAPWLYKIATNVCLDMLRHPSRRLLPFDACPPEEENGGEPLPESSWITPYPSAVLGLPEGYASPDARYEQREAVELAFVAALQHLPARQRAILVLRDVLGFSIPEITANLETTTGSVNSSLQRARQTLDDLLPEPSQSHTLRSLGDGRVRAVARRFVDAMEAGDVKGVIDLLDEDSSFAMPPYSHWCQGRPAVARSWLIPPTEPGLIRMLQVESNGQLAFAAYRLSPGRTSYRPVALDVISLRGCRLGTVVAFRNTEVFDLFDLPESLPLG